MHYTNLIRFKLFIAYGLIYFTVKLILKLDSINVSSTESSVFNAELYHISLHCCNHVRVLYCMGECFTETFLSLNTALLNT